MMQSHANRPWLVLAHFSTVVLFLVSLTSSKLTGNFCLKSDQHQLLKTGTSVIHLNSNLISTVKDLITFKSNKLSKDDFYETNSGHICIDKVEPCLSNKPFNLEKTNFTLLTDKALIDVFLVKTGRFCHNIWIEKLGVI